jgi:hypothetical protein
MGGIQDQERLYLVQLNQAKDQQSNAEKQDASIQNLDGSLTIVVMPAFGGA